MKDTLTSQAIFAQIFCFLNHKRCCLAVILLGLCLANEMSAHAHAHAEMDPSYTANIFN